jgi:hypothetical protein
MTGLFSAQLGKYSVEGRYIGAINLERVLNSAIDRIGRRTENLKRTCGPKQGRLLANSRRREATERSPLSAG